MKGNNYGLIETLREASLNFATACAEVYAGAAGQCACGQPWCRACGSGAPAPRGNCRTESDFLADVVRLHVSYISQIAQLSSSYSSVAARFLQCLNGSLSPYPDDDSMGCEVCLMGHSGSSAVAAFTVVNSLPCRATLQVDGLRAGAVEIKLTEVGKPSSTTDVRIDLLDPDNKPLVDLSLDAGQRGRLVASVDLKSLTPGTYSGKTRAHMGGRASELRFVIHVLA